jgi:hypothetical protein
MKAEKHSEYIYVVAYLPKGYRLIECKSNIQWILQKKDLSRDYWRSKSFFLFKSEIISALARLSIDSTTIDKLPVRFRSQFKHAQSEQMEYAGR